MPGVTLGPASQSEVSESLSQSLYFHQQRAIQSQMAQPASLSPASEGSAGGDALPSHHEGMARTKSISALDALAEIQAAADRVLEAKSPKVPGDDKMWNKKPTGPPRCATAQPRRFKSMGPTDHLASQCWACGQRTQHLTDMCVHCRVRLSDGGPPPISGPPAYFHFNIPDRTSPKYQKREARATGDHPDEAVSQAVNSPPRPVTAGANRRGAAVPAGGQSPDVPLLLGRACATEVAVRKRRPPSAFELERRRQAESRKQEIQEYKRAINRL